MNPAAPPVLESVDTEWDRARAAKELLNSPCNSERGPDLHYGGAVGADRVVSRLCAGAGLVAVSQTFVFGGQAVTNGACLWREVGPTKKMPPRASPGRRGRPSS